MLFTVSQQDAFYLSDCMPSMKRDYCILFLELSVCMVYHADNKAPHPKVDKYSFHNRTENQALTDLTT